MSDFFEPPEPPPPPEPRPVQPPPPPWRAAPRGVLPGVVPLELMVARSDRAAVSVRRINAYPEGFEFDLIILTMPSLDGRMEPMDFGHPLRRGMRGRTAADQLKFGIQFADGSKATNTGRQAVTDGVPAAPTLQAQGGGGSETDWRQNYWVWPLPPAGPLAFACEWPEFGIEFTKVGVDAQLVIDAAARAERVFQREGDGVGVSWSSSSVSIASRTPDPPAGD